MATELKLLDINGVSKLWNHSKEYLQNKFKGKIFVGTYAEYRLVESQLEAGALVVITDDAEILPADYVKLVTDENDFYTAKGEIFALRKK